MTKYTIIFLLSVFYSQIAFSEAQDPKRLPEVVVSADSETVLEGSINKPLEDFSGAASVVEQKQIAETKPISSIDVLQSVPGINVTTEDGRGLRPNIGIRGIDPDRSREGVLLLSDGVPIAPAMYGDKSAYYNTPIEQIERIEVIKGASSVLYGPGNIGGVINYITKRPPADPGSVFDLSQIVRQGAFSDTSLAFGSTGESGIGTRFAYSTKQGETVRDNTDTNIHDLSVRSIVPNGPRGEISTRLSYYYEDSNTPGGLSAEQFRDDPNQSIRSNDIFRANRLAFDVNYIEPFSHDLVLETLFYANYFERNWYIQNAPDDIATTNSQILRDFVVLGIEPRLRFGSWTGGMRFHHESMDDQSVLGDDPSARDGTKQSESELETFAFATYLQRETELFEDFTLTPGVRYEYIDQSRDSILRTDPDLGVLPGEDGSAITHEFVGALTFNYKLTPSGAFYGGVQRSFEPPQFNEAIDPTTGTDNDLSAETGITYEIGYRSRLSESVSSDITFFLLDFEDKIINQAGVLSNAGETRHKGVELSLTATPTSRLTTNVSATFLETEFRDGVNRGNDTPMAPDMRLGWAASYKLTEPWSVRVDGFFVDDQFTDAANTREESADGSRGVLPDYDVWNLRTDYKLGDLAGFENVSLFAGVQNIFDEEYRERRQAFFNGIIPGLTRTVYGGIQVRY